MRPSGLGLSGIFIPVIIILPGVFHLLGFSFDSAKAQTAPLGNQTEVTFTGTAMSTMDALPGHSHHQAVVVLPARHDGALWVGTVSWVSSKPVELRLLYDYNFNLHPDAAHGTPPITQFQLNRIGDVAIALIKPTNVITTGGNYFAGTEPFVAKAVALHNILGVPFTVTYSVDATPKPVTK